MSTPSTKQGSGQPVVDGDRISAWLPEQDRHTLAVLGKLIEELSECSSRAARCILQGLDKADPDSGRSNAEELTRELSDVRACMMQVEDRLGVSTDASRVGLKYSGFDRWHARISEAEAK